MPEQRVVLQQQVQRIELFKQIRRQGVADLARVFAGNRNAVADRIGVLRLPCDEGDHIGRAGCWMQLFKQTPVGAGINQRGPLTGIARGVVERDAPAHFEKTHQIFGALDVAENPVEAVGYTAEHGTTQVSLLPPPWDEFTTKESRLRATRVSPPGVTQVDCPRST